ncbi:MAG: carboxypeptidase-like regulatory domain-containing protein [Acidobacteriaceae bacterium]
MIPARKLTMVVMGALLLASSALCQSSAATHITGVVRNSAGKPQKGATVEVFAANASALLAVETALTDDKGKFSVASLLPGQYLLRVSAPAFLPSIQDHINVAQNAHLVLNFTLSTIFRAEEMLPARRAAGLDDDDWKWTLRSAENRALLHLLDPSLDPSFAEERGGSNEDRTTTRLAFMAGGGFDGLGGMPSVMTDFNIEQGLSSGALVFRGNVGYGGRDPDGMLRLSYARHHTGDGFELPEVAFLVRRTTIESPRLLNSSVNTYGLSFTETAKFFNAVDVRYGAELENASVVGPQVYFEPFLDAALNVGADGRVFYRQRWAGLDDPDNSPRLSVSGQGLALERGRHQEAGYEHRWKRNHFAASYYRDSVSNLAITGMGPMEDAGPNLADAILAGSDLESFTSNVGSMHAQGVRLQMERKFSAALEASGHVTYGDVLYSSLPPDALIGSLRAGLRREMRPGFGGDIKLKLHRRTEVESSYNVTLGSPLTSVDALESRSISTAPYLNVRLHQPLPSFIPGHMEAIIDIRNLLAQGYRPVMSSDGRTLYLVQAPRALRGGLAFTF